VSSPGAIHFVRERGLPHLFFPPDISIDQIRVSSDKTSLPPSPSPSMYYSAVDDACSTVQTPYTEDFKLNEENQCSTAEGHRKKSMNKLSRTLGDFPPNSLYNIPQVGQPEKRELPPKLITNEERTKKDQTKVFGRASHSLSSISLVFVWPSGHSIQSHHSPSSSIDDLHPPNLGDSYSNSSSPCNSSGSPVQFSTAPSTLCPPSPATSNSSVLSVEEEQESLWDSSGSLSLSHQDFYSPHRWSDHFSHSASTSLSSDPIFYPSTISDSSSWVFSPSHNHEEPSFSMMNDTTERPQTWTGEWNTDLEDVIGALRGLR
jgi:hypothetical protein